jgi:hypothetical protein
MDRRGTFFFALNPHNVSLHRYHYYRSIASLGSGWVPLPIELALPNDESPDKFPDWAVYVKMGFLERTTMPNEA